MSKFVLKRRFGLELDLDTDRMSLDEIKLRLTPVRLQVVRPRALGPENQAWCLKPCERAGIKVCSPTLPADNRSLDHVSEVCGLLEAPLREGEEPTVPITKKCAFHLHIDVSDVAPQEMLQILQSAYELEPLIHKLLPPSRRIDAGAIALRKTFSKVPKTMASFQAVQGEKNLGVSIFNYLTRGSLEIRYGAGTTNSGKVCYWVVLWSSIVERTLLEGPAEGIKTLDKLWDWLRWPMADPILGGARAFFEQRMDQIKKRRRANLLKRLGDEAPAEAAEANA